MTKVISELEAEMAERSSSRLWIQGLSAHGMEVLRMEAGEGALREVIYVLLDQGAATTVIRLAHIHALLGFSRSPGSCPHEAIIELSKSTASPDKSIIDR
ncbi:hypothetical protein TRIUR3_02045 [Triticum urartu]|uniref:Uncharacterized protein n=1 Tax=Triticum urartu TaxID=4572 RepID=M7ZL92_TRIUA|nr:hypothetical protein TRIUR3_02045 [Triticum urartu]